MDNTDCLRLLFGAYFHQDWPLEADDWQGVVCVFRDDNNAGHVALTARQLRELLDGVSSDEALARQVYDDFGCCYDPRPDLGGPALRAWLETLYLALQQGQAPGCAGELK